MTECNEMRSQIPQQLAVIGFDNLEFAKVPGTGCKKLPN